MRQAIRWFRWLNRSSCDQSGCTAGPSPGQQSRHSLGTPSANKGIGFTISQPTVQVLVGNPARSDFHLFLLSNHLAPSVRLETAFWERQL